MSEPRIILDFPAMPRRVFEKPGAVFVAAKLDQVEPALRNAEDAARNGKWVIGFVAYEAAPAFDAAMRVHTPSQLPLAWFAVFDDVHEAPATNTRAVSCEWRLAASREEITKQVGQIRDEIARGRTYQVNLTSRIIASYHDDPVALYDSLRAAQGGGYHACIVTDEFAIVSASPELFFETHGRHIRTRPMKGTRPRGRFTEEDAQLANELKHSAKDRAENLMIVDLLRNDLGRIANVGSVQVTALYDVEQYLTVHQMTSTIEAELRNDVTLADTFAALFPCGSVTGAPKISTMEVITELEDSARGVYCGALGVIAPGGDAVFNVPIRTVSIDRRTSEAVFGTGAGITYDSDADAEFAEIAAKTAVLVEAWPEFELLETMRAEPDGIVRIERHVARVLESARYFGFAADETRIRTALTGIRVNAPARVRMLVNAQGAVRTELLPLPAAPEMTVTIARAPVASQDRFLFHKTTHRRVYEAQLLPGFDDVLLWNERREVTEFTRGNVVAEIDGVLLTPPRQCGLLAGTFRAELLDHGVIAEQVITLEDITRATRIWLVNSVREWVPVTSPLHGLLKSPFPL